MRHIRVIAFVCALLAGYAQGQTVVKQVRLSNHVEGSTYISSGPHAGSIAYIDGFDVKVMPGMGHTKVTDQELFSTLGLPLRFMARGIAYMPAERKFVFTNNIDGTVLYLTDEHGALQESLHVTWPSGQELPNFVESVVWAGDKDPHFPNHFLVVVMFPDMPVRIATITRDGTVDGMITPSVDSGYASGLGYVGQNQFLLADLDTNSILVMDVTGSVQQTLPETTDIEGITALPDGNIVMFGLDSGTMTVMDKNFQPVPSLTRSFVVGTGLMNCAGMGWNSDAGTFVASCLRYDATVSGLFNIALDGNSAEELVDYNIGLGLPPYRQPAFLSDKHLIATVHVPSPRGIQFYTPNGQDAGGYQINYGPIQSYIPTTGQIVGSLNATGLTFFDALTGANQHSLDLSSLGVTNITGIAYYQSNGADRLLVFDGPSELAFILNLDGTLVSSFNYVTTLGVPASNGLSRIDSGSYAGDILVINADPSLVTIFHLN